MTDKLRVPIRNLLDASLDEARVQRMWRGLQQRPGPAATPRRWFVAGALVACALLLLVLRTPDAGPLAVRGAGTLTFDRAHTELSDGSQIALGADTQLAVLDNNGQSFVLQLDRGRARFDVTPGGPRRWRMECGLASVTVVGTALTIERGAHSLRVEVAHGVVEVRGERVPGGLQRLTAGQSLSLDSRAAPSGDEPSRSTQTLATGSVAPASAAHQQPEQAGTAQPTAAEDHPPLSQLSATARADTSAEPARMPQRFEHSKNATSIPPVATATAKRALDPGTARRGIRTTDAAPAPQPAAAQDVETTTGAAAVPPSAAAQRLDTARFTAQAPPTAAQRATPTTGASPTPPTAAATVQAPAAATFGHADPLSGSAFDPTIPAARPSQARSPDPSQEATHVPPSAAGASPSSSAAPELEGGSHDAARLLAEADRARQRGAPGRALAILRELLSQYPGTSEAGIAGFTLARMQMELDPRAAARALRASLAAATPESLREDMLARLVEAHARSGEPALASRTAAEYRRKYPSGRLLTEVERWAAKP